MVGFDDLKKRASTASSSASLAYSKSTGPKSKYVPVRPHDVLGQVQLTPAERIARSSVLQQQEQRAFQAAPPPIRTKPSTLSSTPGSSSPAPSLSPGLPSRSGPTPPATAPKLTPRANPAVGKAPPPPPGRSNSSSSVRPTPAPPYQYAVEHDVPGSHTAAVAPLAPPPVAPPRSLKPTPSFRAQPEAVPAGPSWKAFTEYNQKDNEDLFGALDELFAARLGLGPAAPAAPRTAAPAPDANPYRAAMRTEPAYAPPKVALSTRPSLSSTYSSARSNLTSHSATSAPARTSATRSYPPSETHSSAALSLLHFLLYSPFDSAWYASSSPMPPILSGRSDLRLSFSMAQRGSTKETTGVCLFGDASVAWWRLSWTVGRETDVRREGRYRPVPASWDGERLYRASETYGPHVAAFARRAVAGGRPVARGECWDVAAEALSAVPGSVPKPFPALGRTHGHLLYYGRAGQGGVWHGGDAYLRPGDVVEWRKVKIDNGNSWASLGAPDHTAVVLSATAPTGELPEDGQPYHFSQLGSVTVVEQSQGVPPAEATYVLGNMTEGEVWFYRPVGLVDFVGAEVSAEFPPRCECWEMGQLE